MDIQKDAEVAREEIKELLSGGNAHLCKNTCKVLHEKGYQIVAGNLTLDNGAGLGKK